MGKIEEVVVRGIDVKDAKLFYSKSKWQTQKWAKIYLEDGRELYVGKKVLSQLLRCLDIRLIDIAKLDFEARDARFLSAIRNCNTVLRFSVVMENGRVVRVVSNDFTAVPHSKVLQLVEKALRLNYEDKKVEFGNGMFAKWVIRSLPKECAKLGEIVSWNLWVYNRNDGRTGLKIGGGFTVLACKNGAIGWKSAYRISIHHRGDYEDLLSRIQESIDYVVNRAMPEMAWLIENGMDKKVPRDRISRIVGQYPVWIREKLNRKLRQAHTAWDVSNAFSYVATHEPVTMNQRISLANHAVEVLKLAGGSQ